MTFSLESPFSLRLSYCKLQFTSSLICGSLRRKSDSVRIVKTAVAQHKSSWPLFALLLTSSDTCAAIFKGAFISYGGFIHVSCAFRFHNDSLVVVLGAAGLMVCFGLMKSFLRPVFDVALLRLCFYRKILFTQKLSKIKKKHSLMTEFRGCEGDFYWRSLKNRCEISWNKQRAQLAA